MSCVSSWVLRLVAVLALCASTAQAREFEEIKKQGKIIVATEGQFAPFNYFQGTKLTGFEIELMELVAQKMAVTVEWKTLGFDALLTGLRQDRWDLVIASHGITEERAKAVTFTQPHYCSGGAIVAKDARLRTAKDLDGKTVAVQTGSSYLESVQKIKGIKEVKNFPQDTDARTALFTDRVDAWVTDRFAAAAALRANPKSGARSQGLLFIERIAAAVAKGNESLKTAYDKALAQVMADGSYGALSKRYFEDLEIRCP
jgi:polar amino acid transport system substrate-binding protein